MGKRQHQKDKMYLTCTEWSQFYGGKKPGSEPEGTAHFRRLPFSHCTLSLQPFEHPYCSDEGVIYDLMNILPFLKKFGIDPATGKKLDVKALTKLNFYKNSEGKFHCPVLYKVFNENSHIIAIKATGNVFCFEAIEQLNIKNKSFRDLLTDEPFKRTDIITLQDPSNLDKFNLSNFHHLKNNLKVLNEEEEKAKKDPRYTLKCVSSETKGILDELKKEYKPTKKVEEVKRKADKINSAHYSTGTVAASLTSTVMEPTTVLEPAILSNNEVRYGRLKKKGYVQLITTHGPLNLELFCEMTPKTCENFVKLCSKGYYDDSLFHRSIKNFMIQGGDPTGTGKGGESFWEKPFKDELKPNLVHQGRGNLAMANSGPNTNKSQFYITYRSCRHLDGKHTVFGRVVGGMDTLSAMEKVETDDKDKPKEEIKILKASVFVDPYEEIDEQLAKERTEEEEKAKKEEAAIKAKLAQAAAKLVAHSKGVGKYITPSVVSKLTTTRSEGEPSVLKKVKKGVGRFGDFSSW